MNKSSADLEKEFRNIYVPINDMGKKVSTISNIILNT